MTFKQVVTRLKKAKKGVWSNITPRSNNRIFIYKQPSGRIIVEISNNFATVFLYGDRIAIQRTGGYLLYSKGVPVGSMESVESGWKQGTVEY